MARDDDASRRLFASHPRVWRSLACVYPVISRRSGGLSIGVNLNTDKVCNFDCVYCCVDRTADGPLGPPPTVHQLRDELSHMLDLVVSGEIWRDDALRDTPADLRRLTDIAFSGDGEPTACRVFDQAVEAAAALKRERGLDDVKLVLITNATLLHKPIVQRGLAVLDAHQGEVWAKLDAGTQAYYEHIDRSNIPLDRVLKNIADCGRARPIVIQSLFMKTHGKAVTDVEFDAYLDRLEWLVEGGCRIRAVQLVTVARPPAEVFVDPLSHVQMDALAAWTRTRLPGVEVTVAYGVK